MRYVGGKTRIAKWVCETILSKKESCNTYIEPFVGSGAVFANLTGFEKYKLGDIHPDLILMWQALQNGWVPPTRVTRDDYEILRKSEPSALRGFVGFGSSFSGKWFGGYTDSVFDNHHGRFTRPYAEAACKSLLKIQPLLGKAEIRCCSYETWEVDSDCFIYCDPPYKGTLGFGRKFDTPRFWAQMEKWRNSGAIVLVSEMEAPTHWQCVSERTRKAMLRVSVDEENDTRVEKLFMLI